MPLPKIAVILPDLSLDKEFEYLIPLEQEEEYKVGCRVTVPFGHTTRKGYIIRIADEPVFDRNKLKPIKSNDGQLIPESLMQLAEWIAEYYCAKHIHTIRLLLPAPVRNGKTKEKVLKLIRIADDVDVATELPKLLEKAEARAKVFQTLARLKTATSAQLQREAGVSNSPIQTLIKEGKLVVEETQIDRDPFAQDHILPSKALSLTEEQTVSMKIIKEALDTRDYKGILLQGVTGCGKTELYLQAIQHCLDRGQQAIVLVPEISLTPQTTQRFRSRFGDRVSVLHSRLSDGERFDQWMHIHQGKTDIVVGARSALFAPFKNLGLIVVDEEHEASYKQDKAPRYHARDVAVKRAVMEKCTVILGSATPSFESIQNALKGKYIYSKLKRRVDNAIMPSMRMIDMRNEAAATGQAQVFSRQLIKEIRGQLEEHMQTILFLNRRGFAYNLQCHSCGYNAECQNCSTSYTYHKKRDLLICHHCGDIYRAPTKCPQCGNEEIKFSGIGTEKIERMANAIFPEARVARMDADTTSGKNDHQKILTDFQQGKTDILIGTQMIAKGLHFPKVTLVGVIFADMGLHLPDFRASERTFQLLTQVAGRAGRGDFPGKVLIQSYTPFHPAIQFSMENDIDGFYKDEIVGREIMKFPPLSQMAIVHFRGPFEDQLIKCAQAFAQAVKPHMPETAKVTDPMPCSINKVKGLFRYQMNFIHSPISQVSRVLRHFVFNSQWPKEIDIYIDVDAQSVF